MYIDRKMLKIIAKHMGFSGVMSEEFVGEHANNMLELIYMKIFNYYAANHTEDENKKLQDLMHQIAKEGKAQDQQQLIEIMQKTLLESPELMDQIRRQQDEIHTQMFFDFMANTNEIGQMELLKHMIENEKVVRQARSELDKIEATETHTKSE